MAAADDLVTLAAVKTYLGISGTDDDDLLNALIGGVSKAIKNYCQDNIASDTYTEYYDGPANNIIILKHRPIISITGSEEGVWDDLNTDYEDGDKLDYSDDDFYYYAEEGMIVGRDHTFNVGRKNIKVVYKAGYDTIPDDVQLAAKMQVATLYNKVKGGLDGVSAERIGDYSITLAKGSDAAALLPEAEVMLRPYVNYAV